jgi:uncharacterized protein
MTTHIPAQPAQSPPPHDAAGPGAIDAPPPALAPIGAGERAASIDTLRGFALLGILWMNIPWFALSEHTWVNPRIDGGFTGADRIMWLLGLFVFDQKMMAIFSALFGAGLVILSERAATRDISLAALYYRRIFWLLIIGLVHGNIIWWGDILVLYAVCGVFLYPLRRLRGRVLVALGLAITLVCVPLWVYQGAQMRETRDLAAEAAALRAQGTEPPPDLARAQERWAEDLDAALPDEDDLLEERRIQATMGSLLVAHFWDNIEFYTWGALDWGLWRAGGLMIVGMGLYKLGVFTARRSTRFYALCALLGYSTGWTLIGVGYWRIERSGWDLVHMAIEGHLWNYVGSLFVALAHTSAVMLLVRAGALRAVTSRLAAVGRMALTNYLAQSLIMTFVFYPWGLNLWSEFDRAALVLFIVGVWTIELLWSPWWLARFRFGPMEWLWRSLTYWRPQPMRVLPLPTPHATR